MNMDKRIREHYASKSLSGERLDAILQAKQRRTPRRRPWFAAVAAAAAVMLAAALYTVETGRRTIANQIFDEIAMNHAKDLGVEIETNDYDELQRGLDRLTFNVQPGEQVQNAFDLVGGRYCSISGQLAGQLKLRHKESGLSHTIYVTPASDKVARVRDRATERDDVPIRVWREGGRFFGLAGAHAMDVTAGGAN